MMNALFKMAGILLIVNFLLKNLLFIVFSVLIRGDLSVKSLVLTYHLCECEFDFKFTFHCSLHASAKH